MQDTVYLVGLRCTGCEFEEFLCFILIDKEEGTATKVGQIPAPTISVPAHIREALGDDEALYRKAMMCLNLSFGIGACGYLRRVLENRITPLLESLREQRKEDGAGKEDLAELDNIINGKIASDKISLAAPVLPESIKVEGDNPLKLVYDKLSHAIHSQDEQAATVAAQDSLEILDHLLTHLAAERKSRDSQNSFKSKILRLRRGS